MNYKLRYKNQGGNEWENFKLVECSLQDTKNIGHCQRWELLRVDTVEIVKSLYSEVHSYFLVLFIFSNIIFRNHFHRHRQHDAQLL